MSLSHLLQHRVRTFTRWFAVLCALLIASVSGCTQTPQEAVVGRWYNGEMSLRFQRSGAVVWNTPQGLAQGRYVFVGQVPRWATDNTSARIRLDVVRNNEHLQPELDLQFVGGERLRVKPVETTRSRAAARTQVVLRRAESDSDPNVPAPSSRVTAGARGIR
ncbi:MAG: hypothetical protein FD138_318 [Planctomycetota bacterium]|nr:MAG: hypothetical protein FD138_318 [Planctomycetota bacterium]